MVACKFEGKKGQSVKKWMSCSLTPRFELFEFGPGDSGDSGLELFQEARFTTETSLFQDFPCNRQTGSKMNLALLNCS